MQCTCGNQFLDAEDFRDHMPCSGNAVERLTVAMLEAAEVPPLPHGADPVKAVAARMAASRELFEYALERALRAEAGLAASELALGALTAALREATGVAPRDTVVAREVQAERYRISKLIGKFANACFNGFAPEYPSNVADVLSAFLGGYGPLGRSEGDKRLEKLLYEKTT